MVKFVASADSQEQAEMFVNDLCQKKVEFENIVKPVEYETIMEEKM